MMLSRRSFTLMEMVLVLALLVVLAAMAYPSLDSMYGDYRVVGAADLVRARWADARSAAVNQGRPYRFAVVRSRGNFRVAPEGADYWANGGAAPASVETNAVAVVIEDALPRGIRFLLGENGGDLPNGETALPLGSVSPDQWMGVVTFLPDGTAQALGGTDDTEVRLLFQSRGSVPMELRLRTLTGTVTARSLTADERP